MMGGKKRISRRDAIIEKSGLEPHRNAIFGIASISKKQDQARVPGSTFVADVDALIR